MTRHQKTKPAGGNLRASGNARDGQATSGSQHSPAEVMALYLLLHTSIASAQRVIARLATYADWAPVGIIEAADLIDHAADLVAAIIANGGAQ